MSSCSVTSDHPYYLRKKQNRNELQTVTKKNISKIPLWKIRDVFVFQNILNTYEQKII